MKNLFTAVAVSLSALLVTQACFAEESPAFIAHQQTHQQQIHSSSPQQAHTTSAQKTEQHG